MLKRHAIRKRILHLVDYCLLCILEASTKSVHVDINGHDNSLCGSLVKPCKTLGYAVMNISSTADEILIDGKPGNGKQAAYKESHILIQNELTIKGINGRPEIIFHQLWDREITINNTKVEFNNLKFREVKYLLQHPMITANNSVIHIKECEFDSVDFAIQLVSISVCELIIKESNFSNPWESILIAGTGTEYANIQLSKCRFIGKPNYSRCAVCARAYSFKTRYFTFKVAESNFEYLATSISLEYEAAKESYVSITKSSFLHNHFIPFSMYPRAGAISLNIVPILRAAVFVDGCLFTNNTGKLTGVIHLNTANVTEALINNNTFENNTAAFFGGAITVFGPVILSVIKCIFLNNMSFYSWFGQYFVNDIMSAPYGVGGALCLAGGYKAPSYCKARIFGCTFNGNAAEYSGGTIYSVHNQLLIQNTVIQSSDNVTLQSLEGGLIKCEGSAKINNVTFEMLNAANSKTAIKIGEESKIDTMSTFVCPAGSILHTKSLKKSQIDTYRHNFLMFAFYCLPCPINHYSLNKSILIDIHQNDAKCRQCPPGGNCQSGVINARDNFWGHLNKTTKSINFFMLPNGYGCVQRQCQFYFSCAKNRKGTLCGECDDGYSESMYSPRCIANGYCQIKKFWIIALVLVIFYILFFLYKKEIISTLKTSALSLRSPSIWYRKEEDSYHQDLLSNDRYILQDDIVDHIPGNETSNEETIKDKQEQNFFAGILKVIFYFYQIEKLSRSYEDEIKNNLIQGLETTISSFFNFHFLAGSGSMSCPSHHATPVTKVLTKALLLSIMFMMFALAYLINRGFHHIKRCFIKDNGIERNEGIQFRERVLIALFEAVLLSYAFIAKTVFSLLTCVTVGNMNVLYMQGSITCYQPYQYAMIAVGFIWVLPFCLMIFLLPTSVHRQFIGKWSIFAACLFPVPYVLYLVVKVRTGMKSNDEELLVEDNVCKAILKNLTGSFKCISKHSMHWEGFLLFRRLTLVSAYSFIKDPIYKSYAIQVIQILILVHHVSIQPFRSKVLNVLETISLTILVMISGINSFTIFVYTHGIHEEGGYLLLLKVFSWIRLVAILFIPAVIGCIVVILVTVKVLLLIWTFFVFAIAKISKNCC